MSAKAVASLSSGLLKRGTRQANAGFVLSAPGESVQPAEIEEAEAEGRRAEPEPETGVTVRMRSTGGETWSPGGTLDAPAAQSGRSTDYCDGSLEALSRRIGPLVSEYLGSAAAAEPSPETTAAPQAMEQPPAAEGPPIVAPAADEQDGKDEADTGKGQDGDRQDGAPTGDEALDAGAALPAVERRESLVIDMVQAFRSGDRMLGEELFGTLTGLAPEEVSRLLYHGSGEVLAATCRALSMDQLHFVSLFVMTRKGTLSRHAVDLRDLGRIVDYFNGLSREAGARLFATWRRTAWE